MDNQVQVVPVIVLLYQLKYQNSEILILNKLMVVNIILLHQMIQEIYIHSEEMIMENWDLVKISQKLDKIINQKKLRHSNLLLNLEKLIILKKLHVLQQEQAMHMHLQLKVHQYTPGVKVKIIYQVMAKMNQCLSLPKSNKISLVRIFNYLKLHQEVSMLQYYSKIKTI